MIGAVFINALRGLARGRLVFVAAALAVALGLLQAMSLDNERNLVREEQGQVQAALDSGRVPAVASGRDKLSGAAYLAALKADSASALREESLHYETLFLVFFSLFSLAAVFGRETARGGLERVLASPVSRPGVAFSLMAASFVFTQVCLTVLFVFLEIRLYRFVPAPGLAVFKYLVLTAMHVMILGAGILCQVVLRRSTALAAAAGLVFLGFASYAIQIAGDQITGAGLRMSGVAYQFIVPQVGTLFFTALDHIRPGVFPGTDLSSSWYLFEGMKTVAYFAGAVWGFGKKN